MIEYFLKKLWLKAPLSWAIIRAPECELLSKQEFKHPIMEIGCGDGLVTQIIFKNKKMSVDLGIDLFPLELKRAEKTRLYKKVAHIDVTNSSLKTHSFSTIFANGVMEHIPDLDRALSEITRILKKGGYFISTSPMDSYTGHLAYYRLFTFLGLKPLATLYGNWINKTFAHYHLYGSKVWRQKLKKAGLKLETYSFYNPPSTILIHDLFFPFAVGMKSLKDNTDKMVLFEPLRKIVLLPLAAFFSNFQKISDKNENQFSSILLVAKKV